MALFTLLAAGFVVDDLAKECAVCIVVFCAAVFLRRVGCAEVAAAERLVCIITSYPGNLELSTTRAAV